ncbi:MAG: bifunctional [glutamine synthetase] adenylyltransferase/[glutamine synthetase]-adenylyl-L-tyrosine phosphorylase, partial [Pseudomonadota bacterium]
ERLSRAPRPVDAARGAEAWAASGLEDARLRPLVEGAAGSSPYLHHLLTRERDWLLDLAGEAPETAMEGVLDGARGAGGLGLAERGAALRQAKRRGALLIALADLGGAWTLEQVTGALTDLADAALEAALRPLMAAEIAAGRLPGREDAPFDDAGFVAFAMGKGGARELNYSSDIDLIFLFDEARHGADAAEARARLVQVCRGASQLLSRASAEGYVFRVDLRLRPDPSVTPICQSMEAAERYYESLGRTWERAAWIKARPCVGDLAAGEAFRRRLRPFVWRRHLDFAAIRDAHDIRERIRDHRGGRGAIAAAGHDLKLGRGGIREIEFFVQTRQLIAGGRDPDMRLRGTREALARLAAKGWVEAQTAAALDAAYAAHRELEHRLQMIDDRQTHEIPAEPEARARVAALAGSGEGEEALGPFDADLETRLRQVAQLTEPFFAPAAPASQETAAGKGAALGEAGAAALRRWRAGEIPATRSDRAQAILARLEPAILGALARAASPPEALTAFDRFLSGLPAGVQILSLFEANPRLLDLIAEVCAAAPRLADHLGRNPTVVDALLTEAFFDPLAETAALQAELEDWLAREGDYERRLDAVRRWAKEQRFRLGVQALRGLASGPEVARGFTAVAEACLRALAPLAEAEFARRHGPAPGRGAAVLALGRLGSREMTAASDLDLIVLYDAQGAEQSEGARPLPPSTWFARYTQALVSAATAPTAEGRLYEIDMRLRPSGRQGTVASSLAGFRTYQAETAWTWERLALTRARAAAGGEGLRADLAHWDRADILTLVRLLGRLVEERQARVDRTPDAG